MSEQIEIIDVIHHYSQYAKTPQVFVVISRQPEYVYTKTGNKLMAHDGGFYDFMYIDHNGFGKAFAGREFDIKLDDGSTLHCAGQVWSGGGSDVEPMMHVGCATIEELERCYVFCGAEISKAKYDAWLAKNTPTHNYDKYDRRNTIAYWSDLYSKYPDWDQQVSPKRARKLRQRGVTIRRHPVTGKPCWSQGFERYKAEIAEKNAPGYKGRFHPDNKTKDVA